MNGLTVGVIAQHVGGDVEGDPSLVLSGVLGLEDAGPEQLSFLANRRYARVARSSAAGAVLIGPKDDLGDRTVIRCADPYAAFAKSLALFHPSEPVGAAIHPQAFVAADAVVEGARIDAMAVVASGAQVGPGSHVGFGAVVGPGAVVGRDCHLMPNSTVCAGCIVGDRVRLNPGAVVGSEGFGFAPTAEGNLKIPQVGKAVVEDDVEVGANSCVDRAALGETRVRRGAKLDNFVQVGHAADIGEHSLLVAYAGVAGSSRLGKRVTLAAKAAVLGHIEVGDGAQVGVASAVHKNVPEGAAVTGIPAIDHRQWLRAATAFKDLPDLMKWKRDMESPNESVIPGTEVTIRQIMELLPHRYPFLMVDRVLRCTPGESAEAVKCVSINEPFFQGHFPGNPIMPGVLIAEGFAQVAGVVAMTASPEKAGNAVFLMGLDRVRFRRPVTPGDQVHYFVESTYNKRGIWKFKCRAEVDGTKVADGEVMATEQR